MQGLFMMGLIKLLGLTFREGKEKWPGIPGCHPQAMDMHSPWGKPWGDSLAPHTGQSRWLDTPGLTSEHLPLGAGTGYQRWSLKRRAPCPQCRQFCPRRSSGLTASPSAAGDSCPKKSSGFPVPIHPSIRSIIGNAVLEISTSVGMVFYCQLATLP